MPPARAAKSFLFCLGARRCGFNSRTPLQSPTIAFRQSANTAPISVQLSWAAAELLSIAYWKYKRLFRPRNW